MSLHQQVQNKKANGVARQAIYKTSSHQNRQYLPAIIQRARTSPDSLTPGDVLQLQRTIGNKAVGRVLFGKRPKISHPAHFSSSQVIQGDFLDYVRAVGSGLKDGSIIVLNNLTVGLLFPEESKRVIRKHKEFGKASDISAKIGSLSAWMATGGWVMKFVLRGPIAINPPLTSSIISSGSQVTGSISSGFLYLGGQSLSSDNPQMALQCMDNAIMMVGPLPVNPGRNQYFDPYKTFEFNENVIKRRETEKPDIVLMRGGKEHANYTPLQIAMLEKIMKAEKVEMILWDKEDNGQFRIIYEDFMEPDKEVAGYKEVLTLPQSGRKHVFQSELFHLYHWRNFKNKWVEINQKAFSNRTISDYSKYMPVIEIMEKIWLRKVGKGEFTEADWRDAMAGLEDYRIMLDTWLEHRIRDETKGPEDLKKYLEEFQKKHNIK